MSVVCWLAIEVLEFRLSAIPGIKYRTPRVVSRRWPLPTKKSTLGRSSPSPK